MLDFIGTNWVWILLIGGMVVMHLGHGGHRGHATQGNRPDGQATLRSSSARAGTQGAHDAHAHHSRTDGPPRS